MIIFTEHDEVVMSVDDMRRMIRAAHRAGHEDRANHPEIPQAFAVELYLRNAEREMRK